MKITEMIELLSELKKTQSKSTCLKRQVACIIVKDGQIISRAFNQCEPPDGICQRMGTKTGTKYDLCNSTHAEILSVQEMEEQGLRGGKAYLLGHYYACKDCASRLKEVGVTEIELIMDE